ncbi:MAG: FxsA family protein [Mycobacterium sp.]|nr:FxsA family protein [Mycobacterium sp.]
MRAIIAFSYLIGESLAYSLVAKYFGIPMAVFLLVGCSVLGAVVLLEHSRRTMERILTGEILPRRAGSDEGMISAGALLLFLPGLLTSVLGVALLLAPTRELLRPTVAQLVVHRGLTHPVPVVYRELIVDGHGAMAGFTRARTPQLAKAR